MSDAAMQAHGAEDPPLMSVVIPAYNHARFIDACLASVRDQTYPRIELILIDDGSKDDTFARAQQFIARHGSRFERAELVRQENSGVSTTLNRAVDLCRGEWVHILASDDLYYPNKIETEWQAIRTWNDPRVALVYADVDYVDDDGKVLFSTLKKRPPPGPEARAFEWMLFANRIPAPTVAFRKEAFLTAGGFDPSLRQEDWDCWLRMSADWSLARVPERLACYRRHDSNASSRQLPMFESTWRTLGKFRERHGDKVPASLWRACYRRLLRSFRRWARRNAPGEVPGLVWQSLRALLFTPTAAHFMRYAGLCRTLLDRAATAAK